MVPAYFGVTIVERATRKFVTAVETSTVNAMEKAIELARKQWASQISEVDESWEVHHSKWQIFIFDSSTREGLFSITK